ncbi:alpha/beta hydrolase [Arthrobacter burdickii]|uniref:Alpha/beta fold hydrolase n=1 Tax=Arthrobacter burdickii TaxID=3035920 RepID=A0ABT8K3H7_9MICC|nr:alpha/beta fold hydrolase [Arthrobacter burdickii]MDN4611548.1 alpha/beta fold hydrolase [Arthrobacter burdickii]
MAQLTVSGGRLGLRFESVEKALGLVQDLSVPVSAVVSVAVTDAPFSVAKGLRAPGFALPGRTRIGTWRSAGQRTLVAAKKNQPAVVIALRGGKYSTLVIGTGAAAELAEEILAAAPDAVLAETDVCVRSGDVVLSGTHVRPATTEPVAQVLLLPGSGEVDRNADHRRIPLGVSRDLAHAFAARGIASLRYDKRGVGRSTGSYLHAGISDNTADAAAMLAWLQKAAHATDLPVFLVGHSEGAMIAELLAADQSQLAGVVLLAAPGTTGEKTMSWQTRQLAQALPPFVGAVIKLPRIDITKQQRKSVAKLRTSSTDTLRMQGRTINARWQRELLDFDPATVLPHITAPVLAITGGKDLQVNPDDLEIIREQVPGPVEVRRPANLTHLLRSDPKPASFASYKKLVRKPTDADTIDAVTDWIAAHASTRV